MSARDDYPQAAYFAAMVSAPNGRWQEVTAALDEIDALRQRLAWTVAELSDEARARYFALIADEAAS